MTSETETNREWTPVEPVTEDVKKICIEEQSEIEKKAGTSFPHFTPLSFRLQTEAGIFYLVKVQTGEDVCVHAIIHKSDGGILTVTGVLYPKLLTDPLVPF
ncbi:hypothetical protein R3I93_002607 [Phoxinus phoxinus]|uniref:Uncharacterized protein n=1 Tax=Phoxinus phoxinus TaxID=58324 RepID=A0AAN9DG80_9TELE